MHLSLVANRLPELFQKTLHQFFAALRRRCDLVVPRDALRLVVTNTTTDQVDLVAEVIVQHAVRKLGFLRDHAHARCDPSADWAAWSFQFAAASLQMLCPRLNSESPRQQYRPEALCEIIL